jgi:hypothetical protein
MKTLEQHIAKVLDINVETVVVKNYEFRENFKGQKLQAGNPVYYKSNQGVGGEPSLEFAGWVINGRFYRE